MVAALFDAGNVAACRVPVAPLSDLEFADALACRELELLAAGDDPVRVSLQRARRSAISLPPSYVPAVISWSCSLPSGIRMVAMNDPGPTALRRGYSRR